MSTDKLARVIDEAFEGRDKIGPKTKGAVRKAVNSALDLLDAGQARVAERDANGQWHVNQWLKKAVLLSFRLNDMALMFVPSESIYAELYDSFDDIFQKAYRAKVIIVSPSLLMLAIQVIQQIRRDARM